jgi:hypothetical protein
MTESYIHELVVTQSPSIKDMSTKVQELQFWKPIHGNDW